MKDWKKYYEESLYPLQDGILNCVKNSKTLFYLTGGTALSRGYFNHRFSDDLDLFVNNDNSFRQQSERIIDAINTAGYVINRRDAIITEDYITFNVTVKQDSPVWLKIDLVNDTAPRFCDLTNTPVFNKTDHWQNILSNKLCALLRLEIKDFADIRVIARNKKFNWGTVLDQAREKEMGLDPVVLADLMKGIPRNHFSSIRWVNAPGWEEFQSDYSIIVSEMLRVQDNTLWNQ